MGQKHNTPCNFVEWGITVSPPGIVKKKMKSNVHESIAMFDLHVQGKK